MPTEKLTVTLPKHALEAVDQYKREHSLKSRDQVIEIAIALLAEHQREEDYEEALEQDPEDLSDIDPGIGRDHGPGDDDR